MFASYGMGDVFFLWSTQKIGVASALAIACCYPLWTALAGTLFRQEWLSLQGTAGLLLTVAGVICVILSQKRGVTSQGPDHPRESRPRRMLAVGVLFALVTSLFWAVNSYAVAEGGRDLPISVANTIRMLFALGWSFSLKPLFDRRASLLLPMAVLRANAIVFLLESVLGSYFYLYGLTHSTLAVAATLTSLAPVVAVPVSWALRVEKPSLKRTLSVCLVVVGISLLLGS